MKTTLTPLDPADFIGPAPVLEPDSPSADEPFEEKTENETTVHSDADAAGDDETAPERFIGPRVKLTVEVDAETFDADVDAAFRKLAREVRIPGFRPGRAPRRVLESHFGAEIGRVQALEEAVPRYYAQAVRDHQVDVVNEPELELTLDGSDGPVAFEATVEIRPEVAISGYRNLRVEIPSPVPPAEDIDRRIDETRHEFADLAAVDRPAAIGDQVTIDIEGSIEGTSLPGLSAQDYLYEIGSGGIVPEVDERLEGCRAGDHLSFSASHPTQTEKLIDFEIAVGKVSELVLPELTDEWVDHNTEHDSVAELRAAAEYTLRAGCKLRSNFALRDGARQRIAELVEGPVPEAMVNGAIANRLSDIARGLQQRSMTLQDWLEATDQDAASFAAELRDDAESEVRLDLALRALAAAEGLAADEDDIEAELERVAEEEGRSPNEVHADLIEADGLAHLAAAIAKNKAMRWAIEAATLVGPAGEIIEREALAFEQPDASDEDAGDLDGDADELEGDLPANANPDSHEDAQ